MNFKTILTKIWNRLTWSGIQEDCNCCEGECNYCKIAPKENNLNNFTFPLRKSEWGKADPVMEKINIRIIDMGFELGGRMQYSNHAYAFYLENNPEKKYKFVIRNGRIIFEWSGHPQHVVDALWHTIHTEFQVFVYSLRSDEIELENYTYLMPKFVPEKNRDSKLVESKEEFSKVLVARNESHSLKIGSFVR